MDELLKEKAKEIQNFLKLMENKGKKILSKISIRIYGKPEKDLIDLAKKIISSEDGKIYHAQRKISSKSIYR